MESRYVWFWQTSCVGGSERSSTNVKLDGTGIAKFRSKVLQELFQIYGGFFEEHSEDFVVNCETFNKKVLELESTFNKWNPCKRLKETNSQLRTGTSYLKSKSTGTLNQKARNVI